ncbi:MAG TPA: hypothetical protein VFI47_13685, partial [Acidimicrobiales bacterium]|nr:hypothetical protein [Acidimicrobiales bacterium]
LTAPHRRDLVRSWPAPDDHDGLDAALDALAADARTLLAGSAGEGDHIVVETALDCRYGGQSHELTVPSVGAFHDEHRRRNGYARPGDRVEVVALRAVAVLPPSVRGDDLPAPARLRGGPVTGPAVIAEAECTIWVAEGWLAAPGAAGALVLRRTGPSRAGEP